MTIGVVDESQRRAAKVVGFTYLAALPLAIFAEFVARGTLIVGNDAARTAANIATHERLFRLGIASNLTVCAIDIALITALYLVLKPVSRYLALLALGWGLIETVVLAVGTLTDFDVLRILSGAPYLNALGLEQLQSLARLSISAHTIDYNVGLFLAGLRSTTFCWLWFRSGYIPKALSLLGIVASFLMGACAFAFVVYPELASVVPVALYGGPIFLFELTMGVWLLAKRLRGDA